MFQHLAVEKAQCVGGHPHRGVTERAAAEVTLVGHDVVADGLYDRARLQEAAETAEGVNVVLDGALGAAGGGEGVRKLADEGVEIRHVFLQGRLQGRRDRRKLAAMAGAASTQPAA